MRLGIAGDWKRDVWLRSKILNSRSTFFTILFIFCVFIGYAPEWLPHYYKSIKNQSVELLGRLSSYRAECDLASQGNIACTDLYVLPMAKLKVGLDRAIGIGVIAGDIEYGCYDQSQFHPAGIFGDLRDPGKLTNQYRQYRVINFNDIKCSNNFAVAVFGNKHDARHGYTSGLVITGKANELADYQKLQDFFSNTLPLSAALIALIAISIAFMLRRFVQNNKQMDELLEIVLFKTVAVMFGAGIVQVLLPVSSLAMFYRKYNNYFYLIVLAMVINFYLSRKSAPNLLSRSLRMLIDPLLFGNAKVFKRFFSPGSLIMFLILSLDNWSMIYVYGIVPIISVLVVLTGLSSYEAFLFAVLSISGDLKLFNIVWGPGSDVLSYYITGLIIYELHRILRDEIDMNIRTSIERFQYEREVTAHMVHDIRSPVGVIRLLLSQISWKPEQTETREIFLDSIMKIQHLSRSFLAERSVERLEIVYLEDKYFERLFRTFPKFDDRVVRRIYLNDLKVPLRITLVDLDRILLNLLLNAYEARNVSYVLIEGKIINDSFYKLIVTNDGDSVPVSILKKILTVGTTFGKQNGTGFGIQSVKRIIEEAGGKFTFESDNDLNIATVTIPISQGLSSKAID